MDRHGKRDSSKTFLFLIDSSLEFLDSGFSENLLQLRNVLVLEGNFYSLLSPPLCCLVMGNRAKQYLPRSNIGMPSREGIKENKSEK